MKKWEDSFTGSVASVNEDVKIFFDTHIKTTEQDQSELKTQLLKTEVTLTDTVGNLNRLEEEFDKKPNIETVQMIEEEINKQAVEDNRQGRSKNTKEVREITRELVEEFSLEE